MSKHNPSDPAQKLSTKITVVGPGLSSHVWHGLGLNSVVRNSSVSTSADIYACYFHPDSLFSLLVTYSKEIIKYMHR